jgi:hypothetical protein
LVWLCVSLLKTGRLWRLPPHLRRDTARRGASDKKKQVDHFDAIVVAFEFKLKTVTFVWFVLNDKCFKWIKWFQFYNVVIITGVWGRRGPAAALGWSRWVRGPVPSPAQVKKALKKRRFCAAGLFIY